MTWDNDDMENSVIIDRRPAAENEFIFKHHSPVLSVNKLFSYIESISNISIEPIPREELPFAQGCIGWRVTKK